eukprot:scaffold3955_cov160-Cylindrotheca_fusiformis.AAC.22
MAKRVSASSAEESGRGGKRRKSLSNDASCTVFVGNLKYETKWQALKDHMRRAGNVDSASILEDNRTKRSKGCGMVTYQDPRDAARAIRELNETQLEGRTIFVQADNKPERASEPQASSRRGNDEPSTAGAAVYVGNLSYDCSWQDLKDKFKPCGFIEKADIIEHNGKSKGYGKVIFSSPRDVQEAIKRFDGTDFQGRSLIVKPWGTSETYTLYCGNLSFDCRHGELRDFFRGYGKIDNVEIAVNNGRSKGFGFVDFVSRDDAKRAMGALDGKDFQGRPIKIKWDRDSSAPVNDDPPGKTAVSDPALPNTTVYVGNLDYSCRWQDLKQLFSKFGRVEHAEIAENPATKRSKGFGTVQFLTSAQAKRAIEKVDGTEFQDRTIQVKWDRTKGIPEGFEEATVPKEKKKAPKNPPKKKEKRPEPPAPTLDGALSAGR